MKKAKVSSVQQRMAKSSEQVNVVVGGTCRVNGEQKKGQIILTLELMKISSFWNLTHFIFIPLSFQSQNASKIYFSFFNDNNALFFSSLKMTQNRDQLQLFFVSNVVDFSWKLKANTKLSQLEQNETVKLKREQINDPEDACWVSMCQHLTGCLHFNISSDSLLIVRFITSHYSTYYHISISHYVYTLWPPSVLLPLRFVMFHCRYMTQENTAWQLVGFIIWREWKVNDKLHDLQERLVSWTTSKI